MSRTTSSYESDRTFDIMVTDGYQNRLKFEFSNKMVTGIQKLVQMVVIRLFTAVGSNIFESSEGTTFGTNFMSMAQTQSGLSYHYLAFSLSEIVEQLNKEIGQYADENIRHASIENYVQEKDSVDITIYIVSEAGESCTFILPLTTLGL